MAEATKRTAVVTGANKGIGFAVSKQLASNGITVVLTSRDEKRGLEAVHKLKQLSLPGILVFHQLDVTDHASIESFADFIKNQFGKLDILVNNAGIGAAHVDAEAWVAANVVENAGRIKSLVCRRRNEIVNVSSSMGSLENIPNGWPKEVLSDIENLTEEKIDEVLNEFIKDFKEGSLETKGWPIIMSAYSVSKASLSAYTRILAKKYPSICISAICPGFVKTDINSNTGRLTPDEGAESIVRLTLLPHGSPSALFFFRGEEKPF